jgi:DNA sulfur modification protein DndB
MKQIILPALRGIMGDWVYYTCLMNLKDISDRVNYADEVHKNENLSSMIQRQLNGARRNQVAEYLKNQPERLFNSLVVATYDGSPEWSALSDVSSANLSYVRELEEETVSSVGFLVLSGKEKLFALDGQHRLAGIKKAVKEGIEDDPYDEVSVLLVSHDSSSNRGLERTRRLFTTLNKTAKPVSKGDIIALDEDDVMALSTRWLIEETSMLEGNKVAFVASNNMPKKNVTSITTIGNLYDVLGILFTSANTELRKSKADLQKIRPDEEELNRYFSLAKQYFQLLADSIEEVGEFVKSKDAESVIGKYRNQDGGSVVFRPIGLKVITKVIATLTKHMDLEEAIKEVAKLPMQLTEAPYADMLWDVSAQTMLTGHDVTVREILLYMLGHSKYSDLALLERYRRETGDDVKELPPTITS